MRRLLIILALLCMRLVSWTQPQMPHANVIPVDDESGIVRLAYRESPYYMELNGSWNQNKTDSSVVYTRQLQADKAWKDYLVMLNVRCGRACRVYVNGREVGYADDSRMWNEFLLSKLEYGKNNKLAIECMKQPKGALLEDSAINVGLNGEPYLIFKSDPGVEDMTIVGDYDAMSKTGTLSIDVKVLNSRRKGKYYVDVELWNPQGKQVDRMGRWVVFNKLSEENVEMSHGIVDIKPWNAEQPVLYTVVVRLRDEKMNIEEVVGAKVGFRHVEVKDGVLTVNGQPVTLKGVTYGVEHTEGWASRDQMKNDLLLMKHNNINAVRTSRFSPMEPYFYELCDQIGLYVVADANLMPLSTHHQVVATDQNYVPMFERRVDNLYEVYKNYTSIIAWSLGNTKDNGVCMKASYKRLKALDKHRPIMFSGADFGESTDIIAPKLPTVQELRSMLAKTGERPFVMAVSANGNDLRSLEDKWQFVENNHKLQGGFVEGWPLNKTESNELRHLFRPFDVAISKITPDDGEFIVYNRNDFAAFNLYILDYVIYTNLRSNIIAGDLPVVIRAGESDKVSMRIPQLDLQKGEELFIRFNVTRRSDHQLVGSKAFALTKEVKRSKLSNNGGVMTLKDVGDTVFVKGDKLDCRFIKAENAFYFLAPYKVFPKLGFNYINGIKKHPIAMTARQIDEKTVCIDAMSQLYTVDNTPICDIRETYSIFSSGDILADYSIAAADKRYDLIPYVDILVDTIEKINWFGLDKYVMFKNNSGIPGTYLSNEDYRDFCTRDDVRWCAMNKGNSGIFAEVLDNTFSFSRSDMAMTIYPGMVKDFRIHICSFEGDPDSCYGFEFPAIRSGIVEPPVISASEARFSQPIRVTIGSKSNGTIRYTLDGSDPTENSLEYKNPFELTTTTIVKARVFSKDMPPSFTATKRFNYDYIVKTIFSQKPNTPYNKNAETALFDGEEGSVDNLQKGWLGFSGKGVTITVELAKPIDVDNVTLRFAHSPETWSFAPKKVMVTYSMDGKVFGEPVYADAGFEPVSQENSEPKTVVMSVSANQSGIGYIKIEVETLDRIPEWHRAKGLKPWLMMDEIIVSERVKE